MNTYRWQEDKSLKNLYDTEIGILRNGLNGDFNLIEIYDTDKTGGIVTAIGQLKYGDKTHYVNIVFPTKYPYSPPKVIPVNISEVNGQRQLVEKLFGKGNQYIDGEMCLIEREEWNPEIHNIGWSLRKAQKWLARANSKEGFPKDEIVEEIPLHFPHQGQVLIPKEFSPDPNLNKGQFTLTQFKPNHYLLEKNILTSNVFKLNLPDEIYRWYKFPEEIKFSNLMPTYSINHIAKALMSYFGEDILISNTTLQIAFYLPGDTMKWHFFKIQGSNLGISMNYLISHVIENEIYLRTKDIFDDSILRSKRVTIIGLGAIGSEVCLSLAKNGVGVFHLFDKDTFEIGNSVRHAANLFYIGEKKSNVSKQLINKVNPNLIVNDYHMDVLQDNGLLEQSLSNSDLCIVLTGEDSVDYMINDLYIKNYDIPFVFAGVSIGSFSGSIQVITKDSACLRCLGLHGLDTLPKPKTKNKLNKLPPEYGNCSGPALPGSEIDIKEISIQVSRLCLQLLLGDNGNYSEKVKTLYKWHGPFGSDEHPPFHWEIQSVNKHKDCMTCGTK